MVKDILEFVGAAVLLYGGLYYGLLVTGRMVGNRVKRQVLHDKDDGEIHGGRTSGKNHGADAKISAPAACRAISVLPVSMHGSLE